MLHITLIALAVWTAFWIVGLVLLQRSEYGQHMTWGARLMLYIFPLFIIYNVLRHAFGVKTASEKLAEEISGKV